MEKYTKFGYRFRRLLALTITLAMVLAMLPVSVFAAGTSVQCDVTHMTFEEPQWEGNTVMVKLTAENGYKMPEKENVTVTVGGTPVSLFAYNPISSAGGITTSCALMIQSATGDVVITAAGVELSHDATFSSLKYSYPVYRDNNYSVPDFAPDKFTYDVELPETVAADAFIYLDEVKSSRLAKVSGDNYSEGGVQLSDGKGTCTYTVTAEDGTTVNNYVVNFSVAEPVPPKDVYLSGMNPVSGDGKSASTPFRTFAEAKELVAEDGTIWICGTVTIGSEEAWSLAEKENVQIKRYSGFPGLMVQVADGGKLTLSDLVIDGGGTYAGGVAGGSPGVQICKVKNGGTMTMNSGAVFQHHVVTSLSSLSGYTNFCYSALYNETGGTLVMNEGSAVRDCYNSMDSGAAGIYNRGSFTMNGGAVSGNTAVNYGGGVLLSNGTFEMKNGSISGNTATYGGALALISSAKFIMSGGAISGNQTKELYGSINEGGGGIYQQEGTVELNGGEISGNTSHNAAGGVWISGGTLTLDGAVIGGEGKGNTAVTGGGISIYNQESPQVIIKEGEISYNTAQIGGGVYNLNGSVVMNGGSIDHNTASGGSTPYGGGVYMANESASFILEAKNGKTPVIFGNTSQMGAGLHLFKGTACLLSGEIRDNAASNWGGGVFIQDASAQLYLSGTAVSGNTGTQGAGVMGFGGTITLSGNAVINDNTVTGMSTKSNLYLKMSLVKVAGPLTGSIGVSAATAPVLGTPVDMASGDGSYPVTKEDASKFYSENDEYIIKLSGDAVELAVPQVPVVSTSELPEGFATIPYEVPMEMQGEGEGTIIWSISRGSLPDGLRIDENTGVIKGTPTTAGTYEFSVQASNSGGSHAVDLTMIVNPTPVTPSIATTSLDDGILEEDYAAALAAEGTGTITWSVTAGALPAGLSLDAGTGKLTGIPTEEGTYRFTVKAESRWGEDTQELTLLIRVKPVLTTKSLPDGKIGVSYSAAVEADGDTPLTFSVIIGALPNGVTLNENTGAIEGTPTESGTFRFTLQVENAAGIDQAGFALNIFPEDGAVNVQTKPEEGTPAVNLPQTKEELEDAVLTEEDQEQIHQGNDIHITLQVKKVEVPADPQDEQKVEEALGDQTLAMYLDISLLKQVGNQEPEKMTQTSKKLRIVIDIPQELQKEGRTFSIIRVHDGVAEILPDLDDNAATVTIETDRFSTYALAYQEPADHPQGGGKPSIPGGTNSGWQWPDLDSSKEESGSGTKKNPQSGDGSLPLGMLVLLACGSAGVIAVTSAKRFKIKRDK